MCTVQERQASETLITCFRGYAQHLPYARLKQDGTYAGWTTDLGFRIPGQNSNFSLNLSDTQDKFLLFVLATYWSRTGPFENACVFVYDLKRRNIANPGYWQDDGHVYEERINRAANLAKTLKSIEGLENRRRVSFREDAYRSVGVLAHNYASFVQHLESGDPNRFRTFFDLIYGVAGLGNGENRMFIKIPLILRELRCQNIYREIPGEYCCTPDSRVLNSANNIDIGLTLAPRSIDILVAVSSKIYELFGDLYDLPLFAYRDLHH